MTINSLQSSVTLNPSRFSAGLDYTAAGQASVTKSMVLETAFTAPGASNVYGTFAQKSTTSTSGCTTVSSIFNEHYLAGVFVDDKFNQNAPANYGSGSFVNEGDYMDVMRVGFVVVRVNGTFDPQGDIYVNTSTDSAIFGTLQNSSTNGYLISGNSYTKGVAPISIESEAVDGLVLISINIP
jgi:hypothetical protein